MTDQITQLFNYLGNQVRVVTIKGEPWFLGMDVLEILGIAGGSGSAYRKLNEETKTSVHRGTVGMKPGRPLMVINEAGLYRLVMRSDKPDAKAFQSWVTGTALPTLRKDGTYSVGEEKVLTGEMTMEEMTLMVINNLQGKAKRLEAERDAALETVAQQDERLNFITVAEYLAMSKRYESHSQKVKLGQLAKMLCESRGLRTSKVHTTYTDRYGRTHNVVIGQYPRAVLERAEALLAAA